MQILKVKPRLLTKKIILLLGGAVQGAWFLFMFPFLPFLIPGSISVNIPLLHLVLVLLKYFYSFINTIPAENHSHLFLSSFKIILNYIFLRPFKKLLNSGIFRKFCASLALSKLPEIFRILFRFQGIESLPKTSMFKAPYLCNPILWALDKTNNSVRSNYLSLFKDQRCSPLRLQRYKDKKT